MSVSPCREGSQHYAEAVSDPQSRPRDGDRKRAVAQVDAAYANGRITAADRALRVGNIESAATVGELELVVRDLAPEPGQTPSLQAPSLQAPSLQAPPLQAPQQSPQPPLLPPPPPPSPGSAPAWTGAPQTFRLTAQQRRSVSGFRIGVFVVVGLMVLLSVGASVLVANVGGHSGSVESSGGPFESYDPVDIPTSRSPDVPVDKLALTVAGLRWFVGRYEEQFGTTRTLGVTIWADRASVEFPVHNGRRHEMWQYSDGEFEQYGSVTTNSRGTSVVDLRGLRLKPLVANIARAKRTLGVEQPETIYVIIEDDTLGDGPEAHIYVSNEYNESAYLATTFGGRVVRSFPFQG